ncbi:hypothetical protein FB107DRAFT_225109, partial [Schizophyllum commune]
ACQNIACRASCIPCPTPPTHPLVEGDGATSSHARVRAPTTCGAAEEVQPRRPHPSSCSLQFLHVGVAVAVFHLCVMPATLYTLRFKSAGTTKHAQTRPPSPPSICYVATADVSLNAKGCT